MALRPKLKRILQSDRLPAYLILAAVISTMLFIVRDTLNATGYLTAWDAGGHLLKANYIAENLLTNGQLSGWFPLWHGGFDLFQFYPPLLYYILGPLSVILEPELALRLVVAGLWVALVPVTYYALRSWHVSRVLAATGTGSLLALNASFGIGLGALYGVGLLPNGLGGVLAIFALGRLKRDFTWPNRGLKSALITGVAIALLVLGHTFSAYWFGLASLILLAAESIGRPTATWQRNLKLYAGIWLVALTLSAYWWIPLALGLSSGEMGPTGALQPSALSEMAANLISARDFGGIAVSLLALGGLGHLLIRQHFRTAAFFGIALLVSLLLSLNLINGLLPFSSVTASSQFIRFQAFFAWTLTALSIFGIVGVWSVIRNPKIPYVPAAFFISLLLMYGSLVIRPALLEQSGFVRVVNNGPVGELAGVEKFLSANLKPGEFVLSEFNWESRQYLGSPHFMNQRLPMLNNRIWDFDGNFPEGTKGAVSPVQVASFLDDPDYVANQRAMLLSRGIRYVISTNPSTRLSLSRVPWLRPVMSDRTFAVYEIAGYRNQFGLTVPLATSLQNVAFQPSGSYSLRFTKPVDVPAGTTLALSEHPWLTVQTGGRAVRTGSDAEHRLVIPEKLTAVSQLEVVYEPPLLAKMGGVISGLGFLALLLGLVLPRQYRALVTDRLRR